MIFATVNLTIKDDESVCDENITLYRGDRNVQVRFVLVNNIFKVVNQTYAQMIIIRPSKESLFTQAEKITNDTVVLTITEEMIDELKEVGSYTFQIRLYDDTMTSRITLPPCNSGLYVGEPIAIEGDTRINDARINFAAVKYSDETLDTFDDEGNYNITEWISGDIISDVKMNKIEDALYSINEKVNSSNVDVDLSGYVTDEELNAKGYLTSVPDEFVTNEELESKGYLTSVPDEFVTDEELNAKGYLTEHQDLSGYVTDEELNAKGYLTEHQDLSGYVTDEELNTKGYLTSVPEEMRTDIDNIKNDMSSMENDISTILSMIDEPPTYTKPTISIALSKSNVEHSKTYDISISTSFAQNDAGNVTGYKVYKNNSVIFENTSISNYTDTIAMQHGESVTYKTEVSYADGPIKNTMLGIPYPSTSIKSGSVTSSGTIKAYALSYYGVIDGSEFVNTNGLTSELRTSKSNTITISLTNQRIIYMYPKSFGNLTSIKDANNFDYINSYTLSNATVNNVEYNIYILTDPVTINNFKQIFN